MPPPAVEWARPLLADPEVRLRFARYMDAIKAYHEVAIPAVAEDSRDVPEAVPLREAMDVATRDLDALLGKLKATKLRMLKPELAEEIVRWSEKKACSCGFKTDWPPAWAKHEKACKGPLPLKPGEPIPERKPRTRKQGIVHRDVKPSNSTALVPISQASSDFREALEQELDRIRERLVVQDLAEKLEPRPGIFSKSTPVDRLHVAIDGAIAKIGAGEDALDELVDGLVLLGIACRASPPA
jgi:hypothetical protein